MEERNRKYDRSFFPDPSLDDRTFTQMVRDLVIYGYSEEAAQIEARKQLNERPKFTKKSP